MHMLASEGYLYSVAMRDDFSGWVEAKALRQANLRAITTFINEWICCFGIFGWIVAEGDCENKKLTADLMSNLNYNILIQPITLSQTQCGHQHFVDALVEAPRQMARLFCGQHWLHIIPIGVTENRSNILARALAVGELMLLYNRTQLDKQ